MSWAFSCFPSCRTIPVNSHHKSYLAALPARPCCGMSMVSVWCCALGHFCCRKWVIFVFKMQLMCLVGQNTKTLLRQKSQLLILSEDWTMLMAGQIHELQLASPGWASLTVASSTWKHIFLPHFAGTAPYAIHSPALISTSTFFFFSLLLHKVKMLVQNFHLNLISYYMGPSSLLGNAQDMSIQLCRNIYSLHPLHPCFPPPPPSPNYDSS